MLGIKEMDIFEITNPPEPTPSPTDSPTFAATPAPTRLSAIFPEIQQLVDDVAELKPLKERVAELEPLKKLAADLRYEVDYLKAENLKLRVTKQDDSHGSTCTIECNAERKVSAKLILEASDPAPEV